jgi:hypothetical protein
MARAATVKKSRKMFGKKNCYQNDKGSISNNSYNRQEVQRQYV